MPSYEDEQQRCCKTAHSGLPIHYFCMDDGCSEDRLLCRTCVHQAHRKHRVCRIDRLIEPLSLLNMNSHLDDSEENYVFFEDKIMTVNKEWQKINEIMAKNIKILREGIIFQLQSILHTFSGEELQRAYDSLSNSGYAPPVQAEIDLLIKRLHFLKDQSFKDVPRLKFAVNEAANYAGNIIAKTAQKIDLLLKKMQEKLQKINFMTDNPVQKDNVDEHEEKKLFITHSDNMDENTQRYPQSSAFSRVEHSADDQRTTMNKQPKRKREV